jgi:carboxyl-terminal processing protease
MGRVSMLCLSLLLAPGAIAWAGPDDAPARKGPSATAAAMPPGLAKRAQDITEAVLKSHLDPPTRQEMLLNGIRQLDRAAGTPLPAGLSRKVSSLTTPEQFAALLTEVWPARPAKAVSGAVLEEALVEGLLAAVPGGAQWMSAKEHRVQEQLAGNRYVGVHIQVRYDDKEKRTIIQAIVPGGPADRAGAKTEDRFESIDGVDVRSKTIGEVVDRLRGESGTDVVVQVRQPGAKEPRTLRMTRGPLFLPTVSGLSKRSSGEWDFRTDASGAVAYLRVRDISASTPHELRKQAEVLRIQGFRALVLDLRGVSSTAAHPAVLLADELLERGRIGRITQADGERTYDATPGSLFPDWPLALLVDEGTAGAAEWFAAALQDNRRAVLVGSPTTGSQRVRERFLVPAFEANVRSIVPVGEGGEGGFVSLVVGRFLRSDGRELAAFPSEVSPTESPVESMGLGTGKGGVKPDHTVARTRKGRDQAPARGGMLGDAFPPVDPWMDPVLSRAVTVLMRSGIAF